MLMTNFHNLTCVLSAIKPNYADNFCGHDFSLLTLSSYLYGSKRRDNLNSIIRTVFMLPTLKPGR